MHRGAHPMNKATKGEEIHTINKLDVDLRAKARDRIALTSAINNASEPLNLTYDGGICRSDN